jgi:GTP-binding protein
VLVDSRHGIKPPDREIMDMLDEAAVSYQVVLTKGDKINEPSLEQVRRATEKALADHPAAFPVVLTTSSEKGDGIPELRATMAAILRT